jgi:class 3 adenylate cyclase
MERRRAVQLALLAVLVVVWAVCFALFVRQAVRGGPLQTHLMVGPPADAGAYPVVARLRPGYPAHRSGVSPGDVLVRVGDVDLRGAMPWTVYAATYRAAQGDSLRVELERGGERLQRTETLVREGNPWREAGIALAFAGTAVLLLLRAPGSQLVRTFAASALLWTLTWLRFQGPEAGHTELYLLVRSVAGCLWAPLLILAALRFPESAWPRGVSLPLWPWAFAFLGLTWTSKWMGIPFSHELGIRLNPVLGTLVLLVVMAIEARNYRRADALGRRQVRWVVLGTYASAAPVVLANLAAAAFPELAEWWHASHVFLVAIPVSILVAVTRSNLLDVDRLLSGTVSYTILLLGLGGAVFAALSRLGAEASALTGVSPDVVQVGAGAMVAFSVLWLEPLLRPRIERVFFAERHALQTGIDELVAEVQEALDVASLSGLVGGRLSLLLRPASCAIYARSEDVFAPLFVRGSPVTPHVPLDSPLLAGLAARASAVDVDSRGAAWARANASDRAVLGSLGAAVLVPVAWEGELAAFIVLGRKSSGDVYTATDLALLGLVGSKLSSAIARRGRDVLLEEARSLQERLRQYVPASVAARLSQGRSPETGEQEVSILFADLRGYTSLAEGRRAEDIFGLVSRYAQAVGAAVTEHGGSVVEFNGDGMMAVFGAPDPLPDKEVRAVEAALQIVEKVGALAWNAADGDRACPEVGVGVATGPAYVGAIRSADRFIWSAIGNTTNLAARLQALTREFGGAVAIDAVTHARAGPAALGFTALLATPIRGLSTPCDVYALMRSTSTAS